MTFAFLSLLAGTDVSFFNIIVVSIISYRHTPTTLTHVALSIAWVRDDRQSQLFGKSPNLQPRPKRSFVPEQTVFFSQNIRLKR